MIDNNKVLEYLKKHKLEIDTNLFLAEINIELNKLIQDKVESIKKKNRVKSNDLIKETYLVEDVLSPEQILTLPKWVREGLSLAKIIGNSKNIIQISDGRKYHLKNKLNDLSGNEWIYFLNSVVNTRYSTSGKDSYAHDIRKSHPSPKPPQLLESIINFFTKEGQYVLDYFMGVGGTLLAASLSNRNAVGIELSQEYINTYKKASDSLGLSYQKTICGDSLILLKDFQLMNSLSNNNLFSLILIDPPYGNMLSRARTGESFKKNKDSSPTPFTDSSHDLGNMKWNDFRLAFLESINLSLNYLKDGGHLVVFIKDLQPEDNNPNLLHCNLIRDLSDLESLKYLGTKIWADQSVNLYPYGYPFSFVPNQIHQYILIFKKTKK
jgi:DNA modification methylase